MEYFLDLIAVPLVIGLAHSLEADHVVAVGNLVNVRQNWLAECTKGALWGLGHTISVMLGGIAILSLKYAFVLPGGFSLELFVGVMLCIIGVLRLYKLIKKTNNGPHGDHAYMFFYVGLVHGLAGSGSIAALLSLRSELFSDRLAFLVFFGLGTILGMGSIALAISRVGLLKSRFSYAFSICIAFASFIYGSRIIYEQAF